jgi:hypothetical protein
MSAMSRKPTSALNVRSGWKGDISEARSTRPASTSAYFGSVDNRLPDASFHWPLGVTPDLVVLPAKQLNGDTMRYEAFWALVALLC